MKAPADPDPHSSSEDEPAPEVRTSDRAAPKVMAEIGGLPAEGVRRTFMQAQDKLMACFQRGLRTAKFMGGDVKFWVKVDLQGKFMHAHLERSDLGDRKTEQCLLDVLMKYTWPTPVGGQVGVATFAMGFDPAPDIPQPVAWSSDRVIDTVSKVDEKIDECRMGLPGTFRATLYLKQDTVAPEGDAGADPIKVGRAIAASATPPDEAAEMAVDCLVGVFLKTDWPDPGRMPVKVRFDLRE